MKILTFSSEKMDNLNREMNELHSEKSILERSTIEDLWKADLDLVEQEFKKCLGVFEGE